MSAKKPKTKLPLSRIRRLLITLAAAILLFGTGYQLGQQKTLQVSFENRQPQIKVQNLSTGSLPADFSLLTDVKNLLEQKYLFPEKLDSQQMLYGAISGLVNSLDDPYTVFLSPDDNQRAKEDLEGSFFGVGIQLGYKNDQIAVIAPLAGMPAELAGVKAGDQILKIDGQSTDDISLPEAVNLIRGQPRTRVTLTLLSQGDDQSHDITIVRDQITVPSVELSFLSYPEYQIPNSSLVAHLKVSRFGESTQKEWHQAVSQILSQAPATSGVILDLRNNPGGLMDQSVPLVSEFISSGVVLYQQDQQDNKSPYNITGNGRLLDLPLIVLVNQGTASASEIVAGALQEAGRATIVGESTFGKGTIQDAQELSGGAGIHLTTGRWLLPSGKHLNGQGLTPDIIVQPQSEDLPMSTEEMPDLQLHRAVEELFK
jgi:carboxyl-terminal processing protease